MRCIFCFRTYRDDLISKHTTERHTGVGQSHTPASEWLLAVLEKKDTPDEKDTQKFLIFTKDPERSKLVAALGHERCVVIGPSGTERLDYTRTVSMRKILRVHTNDVYVFEMAPPKATLKQILRARVKNIFIYFPDDTNEARKYNNEELYIFDEKGERIKKRRRKYQVEKGDDYVKKQFDAANAQEYLRGLPPPITMDHNILYWDNKNMPEKRKLTSN
jgi:hypothetical protein